MSNTTDWLDLTILKYGKLVYLYTNIRNQKEMLDKALSEAKQAILDHYKDLETNARIDELKSLLEQQWSFGDKKDALAVPSRYLQARIKQLQSKKEKK